MHSEWETAVQKWRDQELARFAQRAYVQLGRGFVVSDSDAEQQPIYVTWFFGAPQVLIDAVFHYDPEREALVVLEETNSESIVISCVRIEVRH